MANRKLQGEIDRVLKKVDEGVQVFEQIWDKVYSATTTAQKEKYEGDLKKEIKKLQRLRDQIKTWQGDSSIKDKTRLTAARKLIEEKMEKFKICEKETKTKAFSKEGLAQDRTDPKQKAKTGVGEWVREAIAGLDEQTEELEAEIETLNSGKRKKRSEENPRVSQLKEVITRHKYHVTMLERVLRAVYNDAVTPSEASELKESVDYYIESNQDPDFYEDVEMYDALNLDSTPAPQPTISKKSRANERADDDDENHSHSKKNPSSPRNTRGARNNSKSSSARAGSPKNGRAVDRSPTRAETNNNRSGASAARETASGRSSAPLMSSVVKGNTNSKPSASNAPVTAASTVEASQGSVQHTTDTSTQPRFVDDTTHPREAVPPSSAVAGPSSAAELPDVRKQDEHNDIEDLVIDELEFGWRQFQELDRDPGLTPPNPTPRGTTTAQTPRHPALVPSCFPSVAAPIFDNPEIFKRFDPDTLFFIFYYQQGTYQQYLAARELKRQGWRFHKKYLTWFQRHADPKVSTDEYETGTFIYFDYANVVVRGHGSGWCQRIKSEFAFEYRFLEDELV
ncbi:CCR4-NOT transcription complex subunit 3 [Gracilariopsis chorda]|uniref:CCR4-NOT transcription complex subunit 3 n=1 Tax=Gracilariopsis chorda TaxID=448386 RepID=A0A2V3IXW3_9FLOR|nr:CCR4-NOT transcription complex subunit 3 [Gracilariopsis chorda]|eukprot:PXF46988.1 CCR4-NOT transcription complex subunit 3 [Gracilariopsis chorda]